MTVEDVLALVALIVALVGGQIAITRWLLGRIAIVDAASQARDAALHGRVNEVRDTYVRRDDLMIHIRRIEKGQEALAVGIDRLHQRMDGLLPLRRTAGQ